MRGISLAKRFGTDEVADMLQIDGVSQKRRRETARRYMRKLGIARQDSPRGHVYTTMGDMRANAATLFAEAVRRQG